MTLKVYKAVENTVAKLPHIDKPTLQEAARVTKEFLIQYKAEISAWKPWLKYAVTAVIAILDMLDGVN